MPNNNPQQSSSQQSSQRSEGSQKISERVERTADQASRLADRLSEGAEQTANAALQRVRDARMQAQSGIAEQRAQIAERIRRLGGVLRAGSETLSTDDPYAQNVLTMAGERVERIAEYVEELEPSRIAEDLHTFARRRPDLFFGGAFLLGLGLGRFAKSTGTVAVGGARELASDDDYGETYGESSYESDSRTTYDQAAEQTTSGRREPSRAYVATQRDIGVGAEPPTTGASSPSYGSTGAAGSSGTTLPYGVGGSGSGTASSSSFGTGSTGSSTSSAFGTTGSESRNTTATNTPRETERGQGSKS